MAVGFEVGPLTIYCIVEQEAAPLFDALKFFPTLTRELLAENRSWLQPKYFDRAGKLILCVQSYIVRTPHHVILVDTCVGNHKPLPVPSWNMMNSDRYARNLAATGLTVADVDYVMCTHLHLDHVGWNTRLESGRWVPTFPKATYLFADRELDYWTERQKTDPASCPWITDSVLPIVAARRVQSVKSDHTLNDLVRLVPTPGHSIDHYCVQVGRHGEDAIITGDVVHTPLQVRYPEIGTIADYDARQAGETRLKLFDRICETSTLLCTAHFPSPSIGRIVRRASTFDFMPIPSGP